MAKSDLQKAVEAIEAEVADLYSKIEARQSAIVVLKQQQSAKAAKKAAVTT